MSTGINCNQETQNLDVNHISARRLTTLPAFSEATFSGKAALVTEAYFPPQVGGISSYLSNVVTAFGAERICCVTGVAESKSNTSLKAEPKIYRLPGLKDDSKWSKGAAWTRALLSLKSARPNLLVLGTGDDGNLGLWLQRRLKLPLVLFAHGNEILSAVNNDYDRNKAAFRTADRIVASSRFAAKLVCKTGAAADRIHVVYPGCDSRNFRPLAVSNQFREKFLGVDWSRKRVILTVGNLVSRKGHDLVITALSLLQDEFPELVYVIAGDGPYRSALQELTRELGLSERVFFAGKVSDEELPLLHNLADVFVMPSREQLQDNDVEGFGIVFLEANACGRPVIGGRSGGVPEAILDGETGFLVDPGSPNELAVALRRLLSNKELAQRLGDQGRTRVIRDFQWPGIANQLLEVFNLARASSAKDI